MLCCCQMLKDGAAGGRNSPPTVEGQGKIICYVRYSMQQQQCRQAGVAGSGRCVQGSSSSTSKKMVWQAAGVQRAVQWQESRRGMIRTIEGSY